MRPLSSRRHDLRMQATISASDIGGDPALDLEATTSPCLRPPLAAPPAGSRETKTSTTGRAPGSAFGPRGRPRRNVVEDSPSKIAVLIRRPSQRTRSKRARRTLLPVATPRSPATALRQNAIHKAPACNTGGRHPSSPVGEEGHDYESYRVLPEGPATNSVTHDDPYDYIYQNLPERHKLRKVPDCSYCGAMRFQGETPGFCCRKGKVQIHIPDVPAELKRLFTSQVHDDAKYFRKHIRYINSHFSFASLGVTTDDRYKSPVGTGVYTFRVHGGLYHRLDHLVPGGRGARHLQLYFYDTEDEALSHRVKRSPDLDINIIRTILAILQDNPYVQTFRRNGDFPNLDEYRIELNTNITPDQRRYNAPTASQVAAIWMDGNDPQRCFDRSVVVYGKTDHRPQYIRAWHGCYDALAYPIYNPRGETGWNKYMPYSGSPFTPPSATAASTNNQWPESRDEGTSGVNHGIIS
ncbi:unnamed protein product [Miscanthus lutarioriparius]|uniref:Helitron helicase-like domain-containing protein n=1 Tax=Miscanthus lutarioriparius TaxID=422564 RepID=A0A811QE41_9POAL|nr:unnamed protein product [Miscanthus lutarioriparius]